MPYTRTQWNAGTAPGISAEKLNNIEKGISQGRGPVVQGEYTGDLGFQTRFVNLKWNKKHYAFFFPIESGHDITIVPGENEVDYVDFNILVRVATDNFNSTLRVTNGAFENGLTNTMELNAGSWYNIYVYRYPGQEASGEPLYFCKVLSEHNDSVG